MGRLRNYDRTRILEAAAKARVRRKWQRAIALYRRVLAVEPHNPDIHARIAPLLAETGQTFDAWQSFRAVARASLRLGKVDKALAVYREAATHLPQELEVWEAIARLQYRSDERQAAALTLREGAAQFHTRFHWPQAIHLLRRAHQIVPWDFETVLALTQLLGRTRQAEEARRLLQELGERSRGDQLRRVHAALFRLDGDLRHAWSWLRCAVRPDANVSYG